MIKVKVLVTIGVQMKTQIFGKQMLVIKKLKKLGDKIYRHLLKSLKEKI